MANVVFAVALRLKQLVSPAAPKAGENTLYFKSDDKLYSKNNAGAEVVIGPTAATVVTPTDTATYNAATATGTYRISVTNPADGPPWSALPSDAVLEVWNFSGTILQVVTQISGDQWTRQFTSSWSAWLPTSSTFLVGVTDYNQLTYTGTFNFMAAQANAPSGASGRNVVTVDGTNSTTGITQMFFLASSNRAWRRTCLTGAWGGWVEIGPPTGAAGGALQGTYPNPTLSTNSVGSPNIVDQAVTLAKLDPTTVKLNTIPGPTAQVDVNNQRIARVAAPTVTTDAINWQTLMDAVATGTAKPMVRAATTVANGSQALTGAATIDGIVLATGDRVLVKNQSVFAQNGIYRVNTGGGWFRDADADTAAKCAGMMVGVQTGAVHGGTRWATTFTSTLTLDANPMVWYQNLESQLPYKASCVTATTANITLSGTGQAIDGTLVNAGDRVLVKDQTTPSQNGIYLVAAGAWGRADDADTIAKLSGAVVSVLNTNGNIGVTYRTPTVANAILGTAGIYWYQVIDTTSYRVRAVAAGNIASLASMPVTQDGVTLAQLDRVLLTGQTASAQNGIYTVGAVSAGNAPLTRNITHNTALLVASSGLIEVTEGTLYGGTAWLTPFKATDTLDTSAQPWFQIINLVRDVRAVSGANIASLASAPVSQDGVTLVQGDRLLVANQAAPAQHGVYTVGVVSGGNAPLTRSSGYDTTAAVAAAGNVKVREGAIFGGSVWRTTFKGTDTLDTTAQQWTQVIAPYSANAGGIPLTGGISYAQGQPTVLQPSGAAALLRTDATGVIGWANSNQQAITATPYKDWVKAASTANIVSMSGGQTIDGVACNTVGDRVLVKNQTSSANNGIYIVQTLGWTRALDFNSAALAAGAIVTVASGTVNGGSTWTTNFKSTDAMGSIGINWFQIASAVTPNGTFMSFSSSAVTPMPISTFTLVGSWATDSVPGVATGAFISGVPSGLFTFSAIGVYQVIATGTIAQGGAANPFRRIIGCFPVNSTANEIVRHDYGAGQGSNSPWTGQVTFVRRFAIGDTFCVQLWQNAVANSPMGATPGHEVQIIKLSD